METRSRHGSPSPRQHRLEGAAKGHVVGGCHQVQRAAHRRDAYNASFSQRLAQLVTAKTDEARPQTNEGCSGNLRLHSGQPLDGSDRRRLLALEEHLSRERGAIEPTTCQCVWCPGHGRESYARRARSSIRAATMPDTPTEVHSAIVYTEDDGERSAPTLTSIGNDTPAYFSTTSSMPCQAAANW